MKWLKIDFNNLPEGEVLAANFNKDTYGYREKIIGYLVADDICENDYEILENCTHYIDLKKYDLINEGE